jgi:hypothetical protein
VINRELVDLPKRRVRGGFEPTNDSSHLRDRSSAGVAVWGFQLTPHGGREPRPFRPRRIDE